MENLKYLSKIIIEDEEDFFYEENLLDEYTKNKIPQKNLKPIKNKINIDSFSNLKKKDEKHLNLYRGQNLNSNQIDILFEKSINTLQEYKYKPSFVEKEYIKGEGRLFYFRHFFYSSKEFIAKW